MQIKPIIARVEFKVGKIINCEIHPIDTSSYVLTIDIQKENNIKIVSKIVQYYPVRMNLIDEYCIVFTNLKKSRIKGVLNEGMIMCVANNRRTFLEILKPSKYSKIGERIILNEIDLTQWQPDDRINITKKNSFWKKEIIQKLHTNDKGYMSMDGVQFITKKTSKPIECDTRLRNCSIVAR